MKLFAKSGVAALAFGTAMMALVGKESVSAEEATAANEELSTAGVTGAQLITQAAFQELEEKAGRTDAAEQAATEAKAAADKSAGEAKAAQDELTELRKKPGASHTNPALAQGKSDVEGEEPDANMAAIAEMPHNKALAGNPLFGPRIKD